VNAPSTLSQISDSSNGIFERKYGKVEIWIERLSFFGNPLTYLQKHRRDIEMAQSEFVHRWFQEVWNNKREDAFDEMLAEDPSLDTFQQTARKLRATSISLFRDDS
jgi:hypothetical protein